VKISAPQPFCPALICVFRHEIVEAQSMIGGELSGMFSLPSGFLETHRADVLPVRRLVLPALMTPGIRFVAIRQFQTAQNMVNQL
jgi:hypothetical protein